MEGGLKKQARTWKDKTGCVRTRVELDGILEACKVAT
jgi:hypothetical protein